MDDFDRPLNERGQKDAPHMAKLLKHRDVMPHHIISSPANRALSTCQIFAKTLGFDEHNIVTIDELYHASADTWLRTMKSLKEYKLDGEDILFAFGHNPGITDFANDLLNVSIDNIPTCGIVEATLHINGWREISYGCGKMDAFDYPKKD